MQGVVEELRDAIIGHAQMGVYRLPVIESLIGILGLANSWLGGHPFLVLNGDLNFHEL
jgi:hypothetical protein